MRAGVVDYRMGNLSSVSKALERAGAQVTVSDDTKILGSCDLLVLPGVGNFAAGMRHLGELGLAPFLREWAEAHRPFLGICLGMQLLFEYSEEGDTEGLGVIPGGVVHLTNVDRVPHMGWNQLRADDASFFVPFSGKHFYFVHSYVCAPESTSDLGVAWTDYGGDFVSGLEADKMLAFQFHPEKSSRDGLKLLSGALEVLT